MKKRLFLMIAFLMSLTVVDAENVKTIRLSFNKQNYIPYVVTRAGYIDRPQITQCQLNSSNKTVVVSTNLNENSQNAKVVVASAMGGTCAEYSVSAESPTVIADLSNFADGVQTITLFVDGENVDSKNILKK